MEQASQKTVVETQAPAHGDIAVTGSYVGTVEPGQQVTIYPKANGEVTEANFKVGDTVEAGDVLFTLDSTSLQLDIRQAQANLANAQARAQLSLESAQTDLSNYAGNAEDGLNSSLLQAEASVKTAENSLQQANTDYRTARDNYNEYLYGDWTGDVSDTQRESLRNAKSNAELKVESAQLSLENAKASLEAVKKQVEEQTVSAETSVKSAELGTDFSADQISIQKLQNTLSDYTVTSPISGVVEQCNIDVYDTASSQQAAYVISNKDMVTVSFSVAESALSTLEPGGSVTLEKDGATCEGTISEVSDMVEASSGLYTVKATVENAPFELRTGSAVKLYVETQKVESAILIPIDAVYFDNGTPYVYTFSDNTAHKVVVETGISDAENYEIKSGLSLSDEVIVTWSASLYEGAEVYLPGTAPEEGEKSIESGEESGDEAAPPAEGEEPA